MPSPNSFSQASAPRARSAALMVCIGLLACSSPSAIKPSVEASDNQTNEPEKVDPAEQSCLNGDADQCNNIGLKFEKQSPPDHKSSAEYFEKSCDHGGAHGCSNLASAYLDGRGVQKDLNQARTLFKKACDGNSAQACNNLGAMHNNGNGGSQNTERAAEFFDKACSMRSAQACNNLAAIRLKEGDASQAAILTTKSCKLGHPVGCRNLGWMFENGIGVFESPARAVELYKDACEAGIAKGCSSLAESYASGKGHSQPDQVTARIHFAKACELGDETGCHNLGTMLAEGQGGENDPAKAREMFERACKAGLDQSCADIKTLAKLFPSKP